MSHGTLILSFTLFQYKFLGDPHTHFSESLFELRYGSKTEGHGY